MGIFQIIEGFDSKVTSRVTGSLDVSTDLRVRNSATIDSNLFLPGIPNVVADNFLMYFPGNDSVSYAHRDFVNAIDRTVPRINNTVSSGTVIINTTSSPYTIFDLNGKNIITTNTGGQNARLRLSLFDYNPATYGDFSCTIMHKGDPTQDGGFSNQDMKLDIFLPNSSITGAVTYNVAMLGSDNSANYEMEQHTTYNAGDLIQFSDQTKWGEGLGNVFPFTQGRRMENSGLFHVFCSFSTNYISVHGTNWERIPFNQTP